MAPPPVGYMVRDGEMLGTGADGEKFTGLVKGGFDTSLVTQDLHKTLIKCFKKGGVTITAVKSQEDAANIFASVVEFVQGAGRDAKPLREEVMQRLLEKRAWSLTEFYALASKARCVCLLFVCLFIAGATDY